MEVAEFGDVDERTLVLLRNKTEVGFTNSIRETETRWPQTKSAPAA